MGLVLSVLLLAVFLGFGFKLLVGMRLKSRQNRPDFAAILQQRRTNFLENAQASEHFLRQPSKLGESLEDSAA